MNTNLNNFLKIVKRFIYIIILCIAYTNLLSFTTPYTGQYNRISSDYGPRWYTNSQGVIVWDFHPAIDYNPKDGNTDYGDPIRAVETGEIAKIELLGNAGWIIEIHSPSVANAQRKWFYLHLFGNDKISNPRVAGDYELLYNNLNRQYYIRKNFSDGSFEEYKIGMIINEGEEFAPTGNSGGNYSVHLDIRLNWVLGTDHADNPLIYLNHGEGTINYNVNGSHINMRDTDPIVLIESPSANYVFMEQDLTTKFPIKVIVNTEDCLDLDKLDLWIYKNEKEENLIHIGIAGEPTFRYGGKINENKGQTIRDYDETSKITGVRSITLNEDGKDRFIYYQTFKDLNLPAGKHKIVVKAEDVNGNSTYAQSSFYIVPSDYALYSSGCRPMASATPYLDRVVIKDLKQEPTEEPEEGETVTPTGSAVPTPTPEPEIKVVSIDKYIKGVMLGVIGNADFGNSKYKEGFKALGIAAYTYKNNYQLRVFNCQLTTNDMPPFFIHA